MWKKFIRKRKWEVFIKKTKVNLSKMGILMLWKSVLESESGKYSLENKGELVQDGDISCEKRWEMGSNSLPPPKTNVVKIKVKVVNIH